MSIEQGKTSTPAGATARRKPHPEASSVPNVIDPVRVIRQSIGLLIATGVVGLILGVGVFLAWNIYFPRYDGMVLFELNSQFSRR